MNNKEVTNTVPCPDCGAKVGQKCILERGDKEGEFPVHYSRWRAITGEKAPPYRKYERKAKYE